MPEDVKVSPPVPPVPPVPPWRAGRPSRRTLSAEVIVEAALRVLDAEDLDAVSMRRVAQELGTGQASLYAHVAGKDELLELMFDQVTGEVQLPAPDPRQWQSQIREICREVHRVMAAHPGIARVSLGAIPTGPNALRIVERMLAVLRGAGVPKRTAAWGVDRLFLYTNAQAFEESVYSGRLRALGMSAEEYGRDYRGRLREFFAALPAEQFPQTAQLAEPLTAGADSERFEFGLDLLVGGLAGHIRTG